MGQLIATARHQMSDVPVSIILKRFLLLDPPISTNIAADPSVEITSPATGPIRVLGERTGSLRGICQVAVTPQP